MRDPVNFFEETLAEEGIDATVTHTTDPSGVDTFYVTKQLGDEKISHKIAISEQMQQHLDADQIHTARKKQLVQQAKHVAQAIEDHLTERFNLLGRDVTVSPYEGGWAKCERCGCEVETPIVDPIFMEDAELTTPHPYPRDREKTISHMDGTTRLALKAYLIGRLREHCDYDCPNSKYNELQKEPKALNSART